MVSLETVVFALRRRHISKEKYRSRVKAHIPYICNTIAFFYIEIFFLTTQKKRSFYIKLILDQQI